MTETLPLPEIKAHLSEIVDRVEREHERIVLTGNGRPAAVILSPQGLEALARAHSSCCPTRTPSPRSTPHETTWPEAERSAQRSFAPSTCIGERSGVPVGGLGIDRAGSRPPARSCCRGRRRVHGHRPDRVASANRHPLRQELSGLWAARRRSYLVDYEIDDYEHTVNVLRVDHRADVYRRR